MEFFEIENKNGIRTVRFNNIRKKNALNKRAYIALGDILNSAAKDPDIKCLVLTGKGDFFSSGNDLTQTIEIPQDGSSINTPLIHMIEAFIRFPKLLVGIINGPAIGIGGTMIALCDILYASETAYIYTPFTALGLCAEGCSSVTFPRILGNSKANEMLMLNHRMTAREALSFGFVAHVYQDEKEVWDKLKQIENLPLGSIIANKKLTRKFTTEELEQANLSEFEELEKRMVTEEAFMAMLKFQESRKNKSKL